MTSDAEHHDAAQGGGDRSSSLDPEPWTGDAGLSHEGFFFDDDAQVLRRCVPFIQQAVELDQGVLVIAPARRLDQLREGLGSAQSQVTFEVAEAWWRGPHATMIAYATLMAGFRRAGRPWRLVGEPIWLDSARGRYWHRFEGVSNALFADFPHYRLCLHDHRRLPRPAIAGARRTHPRITDATDPTATSEWRGAPEFLATVEPGFVPAPGTAEAMQHSSLPSVRHQVRRCALDAGLPAARVDDTVLAVDELAANALAVAGSVTVRCWQAGTRLVVEITDQGPGLDEPLAGYVPPPPEGERGRGLWIARALCDDMTVQGSGSGTRIQTFIDLPSPRR